VGISETRDNKDDRRPARVSRYLGTADKKERKRKEKQVFSHYKMRKRRERGRERERE
jgi:hypothetical protein